MLLGRPQLARHVRQLVVRPKTRKHARSWLLTSLSVSASVRELAASMHLEALTTFAWDDDELPYADDMWFALRVGCPCLRYLSTTIGGMLPSPASHVSYPS
jgi:hypothetical protein